jgi:hypothetical protein
MENSGLEGDGRERHRAHADDRRLASSSRWRVHWKWVAGDATEAARGLSQERFDLASVRQKGPSVLAPDGPEPSSASNYVGSIVEHLLVLVLEFVEPIAFRVENVVQLFAFGP